MRRIAWLAALVLAACTVSDSSDQPRSASVPPAGPAPVGPAVPQAGAPLPTADSAMGTLPGDPAAAADSGVAVADMRLEVDTRARELHVYRGGQRVETHSVAVGSAEWPTQPGEWSVRQVVFNPEWIPPDESWAEQRERRAPGDPKNPLGRAQLIYDPPRTIHGTNEPQSIGQAVSHGSIRLPNSVILELAREAMAAAGVERDDAWYRQVQQNRTEKVIVDLPKRIPIRVF
ncbi:L,D-transpeptidase [Roseisolibacter sp. H3M3-2]|uniref:L,D-transpeptidase n=1 Tax=Roseisolibacter sp. H3M3-2 TaxID=3031323 RepID=UPI0023DC1A3B|nr:L,D-transpeptidase [Roseisolibacter sp. H3M3-2]MDF1504225.1 L,D-transpeptidase [Roseisolibacter sp. H3M3-2]